MARRRASSSRRESIPARQKRLRDESYARLQEEGFRRKAERQAERAASRVRFIPDPSNVSGTIKHGEFGPTGAVDMGGRWVSESAETQQLQQEMQAKAEFDAGQMELRYSQKQKREMDRLRMVPQLARQSGIFSKDQIDKIDQKVMMDIMGFEPAEQFKLTQFPKGQGFGESWTEDDGSRLSRDKDGGHKLIQRFDQSREAQSMKEEQDSIKAQAVLQAGIDKEKRAFERDLYTKGVMEGGFERPRTPEEIRQIIRGYGRSKEINEARDLVAEFKSRFSNIDEIPENMRQQFFDAVDLIGDTESKRDMPTVGGDDDYDKLPSGAEFIDSEGNKWRKP